MPRAFKDLSFDECHALEEDFEDIRFLAGICATAVDNEKSWSCNGPFHEMVETMNKIRKQYTVYKRRRRQ